MYPDLSYILHALIGTEPDNGFALIKTFGLFMAFAFVVSSWILVMEFKRREKLGLMHSIQVKQKSNAPMSILEHAMNGLIGFLLGFKLIYIIGHWSDFTQDAAAVLLSKSGSIPAGIVVMLLYMGFFYFKGQKLRKAHPEETWVTIHPHQRVGDITIAAAISGIIGAKLFAIFESVENIKHFMQDPIAQILSGSGLAIYGGLIVAFIFVLNYARKLGIPPWQMMDSGAPAMMIGYAVGRIGCQLSGDGDWGIPNTNLNPGWIPDFLWASNYAHNVVNDGVAIVGCTWRHCSQLIPPVYPTPLYEAILAFIITGILWSIRKKLPIPGQLFFIYMILNGIERYFIEKIRVNDKLDIFGMVESQATFLALAFCLVGIGGLVYLQVRKRKEIA
ncbi:MAG: prolipoprotein diacylglyceryl transferase family protein [Saprospiraceae bacterium]